MALSNGTFHLSAKSHLDRFTLLYRNVVWVFSPPNQRACDINTFKCISMNELELRIFWIGGYGSVCVCDVLDLLLIEIEFFLFQFFGTRKRSVTATSLMIDFFRATFFFKKINSHFAADSVRWMRLTDVTSFCISIVHILLYYYSIEHEDAILPNTFHLSES